MITSHWFILYFIKFVWDSWLPSYCQKSVYSLCPWNVFPFSFGVSRAYFAHKRFLWATGTLVIVHSLIHHLNNIQHFLSSLGNWVRDRNCLSVSLLWFCLSWLLCVLSYFHFHFFHIVCVKLPFYSKTLQVYNVFYWIIFFPQSLKDNIYLMSVVLQLLIPIWLICFTMFVFQVCC